MTPLEIKKAWTKFKADHPLQGQRQKAFEAAHVATLAKEYSDFPKILFNLVIHAGNIDQIADIIDGLKATYPKVLINPYPDQTAFHREKSSFNENQVKTLADFVDRTVDKHSDGQTDTSFVPRLHYWLMLKAAINTFSGDPQKIADTIGGDDLWKCYRQAGVGRYVQIGISPDVRSVQAVPGLRLNCFWNSDTINHPNQIINLTADDVAANILGGMTNTAKTKAITDAPTKNYDPCRGCGMPRLNFDAISLEMGMGPSLKPEYLKLRQQYIGF